MRDPRPNIILLMTDQHRFDCLGSYGNSIIETPNLDWLASEGTVFDAAYSATPSCIPARASLMTGMDPWHTGILGMGKGQGSMGVNFPATLPGELAKGGYYAKGVGKMHFHPSRSMLGFHSTLLDESSRRDPPDFVSDYTRWFEQNKGGDYTPEDHGIGWNSWMARPLHMPEYLHPTNWTANEAIRFLSEKDPSQPFFLKVSFERPHSPYDPPEYYFNLYQDKPIPEAAVGDWASMHDVKEDAAIFDAWRGRRSPEEIRRARAAYYGSVSHIDNQIGRILIMFKRIGELENTLFVFTSDHGDMLGDHNLWRKTYAYEGSAHIPLIVKLPRGARQGAKARVDKPVSLYDIMPTILDYAGLPIPDCVDGLSMLPLIRGQDAAWRAMIHGEHSECYSPEQEMQFLTDGKYKYVWLPQPDIEQLFDLRRDPMELRNVAADPAYAEELTRFQRELIAILGARNNGTVVEGKLRCQRGCPPQVSPHYAERLRTSPYDWTREGKA